MIPKLKFPLIESKKVTFWFISLHFTVIYPTPTILNTVHSGTALVRALLGLSSQEKELEIKKESIHIYICSSM